MLFKLWNALKAGEELGQAATWKNVQASTNALVLIMGLLFSGLSYFGISIEVQNEQLVDICKGIATVGFLAMNTYLTMATSKKIGVKNKKPVEEVQIVQDSVEEVAEEVADPKTSSTTTNTTGIGVGD
jgi:hypothetical protein